MPLFLTRCWSLVLYIIALSTDFSYAIENDDVSDLEQFCSVHTQTSIALSMLEHSSPKGSSSHEQLGKLLHSFSHYHVDFISKFGKLELFQSVAENLSQMMQGYGLKKSTDPGNPNAIVFASAFLNSNGRKLMIENGNNGVIIVQTEQLCCSNWLSEDVFQTLQACEKSDNCVILEYSDHNFQYMKDKWKVSKSVVLLPIMNQGRLDQYYRRHHLPALWERPNDIAFFGTMTEHRNSVLTTIKNPDPTTPEWESIMEQSHDKLRMVKTYLHSKVCLTVHAFPQKGPGEYHRLSELGVSGCVPVMERFEDTLGIQVYKLCGGVVFAAEAEELPDQIASVLEEMEVDEEGQDDSMRRRVEWWKARVKWETILVDAFGPSRKNIEL